MVNVYNVAIYGYVVVDFGLSTKADNRNLSERQGFVTSFLVKSCKALLIFRDFHLDGLYVPDG